MVFCKVLISCCRALLSLAVPVPCQFVMFPECPLLLLCKSQQELGGIMPCYVSLRNTACFYQDGDVLFMLGVTVLRKQERSEHTALGDSGVLSLKWKRCDRPSKLPQVCLWRSPISVAECSTQNSVLSLPISLMCGLLLLTWNQQTAFWHRCCYFSDDGQLRQHSLLSLFANWGISRFSGMLFLMRWWTMDSQIGQWVHLRLRRK